MHQFWQIHVTIICFWFVRAREQCSVLGRLLACWLVVGEPLLSPVVTSSATVLRVHLASWELRPPEWWRARLPGLLSTPQGRLGHENTGHAPSPQVNLTWIWIWIIKHPSSRWKHCNIRSVFLDWLKTLRSTLETTVNHEMADRTFVLYVFELIFNNSKNLVLLFQQIA